MPQKDYADADPYDMIGLTVDVNGKGNGHGWVQVKCFADLSIASMYITLIYQSLLCRTMARRDMSLCAKAMAQSSM